MRLNRKKTEGFPIAPLSLALRWNWTVTRDGFVRQVDGRKRGQEMGAGCMPGSDAVMACTSLSEQEGRTLEEWRWGLEASDWWQDQGL